MCPHFFYGLQWWFFGLLAVGGFLYLVYDEWRGGTRRVTRRVAGRADDSSDDSSEGPEHPAVDGQHHAGHERRGG